MRAAVRQALCEVPFAWPACVPGASPPWRSFIERCNRRPQEEGLFPDCNLLNRLPISLSPPLGCRAHTQELAFILCPSAPHALGQCSAGLLTGPAGRGKVQDPRVSNGCEEMPGREIARAGTPGRGAPRASMVEHGISMQGQPAVAPGQPQPFIHLSPGGFCAVGRNEKSRQTGVATCGLLSRRCP